MWARVLRLLGIVVVSVFAGYLICDFVHPEAPINLPASGFVVANLSIKPEKVRPNEVVTITVSVTNTHDTWGLYSLVLWIDDVKEDEGQVMVGAGNTETITFCVTRQKPGKYTVFINGLSGSFTVVAPVP